MSRRPNANQLAALRAVADGRVQWGSVYPARDRRLGTVGMSEFLIDGAEVYGAQKAVYAALSRRGLIRERTEDIETHTAPPEDRQVVSLSGHVTLRHLPERQVPVDPGWRVAVELTDAGRDALVGHMLEDVPVRFWVCPVDAHRERSGVVTVEWLGGVAHCTAPGCGNTSFQQSPTR